MKNSQSPDRTKATGGLQHQMMQSQQNRHAKQQRYSVDSKFSGFGKKKDSTGSNRQGTFGMSFNMSGVAGRDRQNYESGFVDQLLLEDLNAIHQHKDLQQMKMGNSPVIDSFQKYEQLKQRSNEGSPVAGQGRPLNIEEIRKQALLDRGRDLSHSAYELRNKQQKKTKSSAKKSEVKPIELIDVNKVSLLIEKEHEASRDLDPEEDIHVDRYMMRGSGNVASQDDDTQKNYFQGSVSPPARKSGKLAPNEEADIFGNELGAKQDQNLRGSNLTKPGNNDSVAHIKKAQTPSFNHSLNRGETMRLGQKTDWEGKSKLQQPSPRLLLDRDASPQSGLKNGQNNRLQESFGGHANIPGSLQNRIRPKDNGDQEVEFSETYGLQRSIKNSIKNVKEIPKVQLIKPKDAKFQSDEDYDPEPDAYKYKSNQPHTVVRSPQYTTIADKNGRDVTPQIAQSKEYELVSPRNDAKVKVGLQTVEKKEAAKQLKDHRFQSAANAPNRRSVDMGSPLTSLQERLQKKQEAYMGETLAREHMVSPVNVNAEEQSIVTSNNESLPHHTSANVEQFDQIQELLQMNLAQNNMPDCGNLRSTKRKDVRQRIKCLQALLKQLKQDQDFRAQMKDRGKVVESDETQILKESLRRHETSLQTQNAENMQLKKQMKEKNEQIDKLKQQVHTGKQEVAEKEKMLKQSQDAKAKEMKTLKYQQKMVESQKKDLEKKMDRLNSSVKDSMIKDKVNQTIAADDRKMELTDKLIDDDVPEVPKIHEEFKKMTDQGHRQTIERLRKENEQLKDALLQIQDALCTPVNESLAKLERLDKVEANHKGMSSQFQTLVKRCKINKHILNGHLNSPQDANSVQEAGEVLRENVRRFKRFSQTVLNPITIADLVEELEAVNIKNVERDRLAPSQPQPRPEGLKETPGNFEEQRPSSKAHKNSQVQEQLPTSVDEVMQNISQNINSQIRSISPMQRREGGQTTTTPMRRAANVKQPTRFDDLDQKNRSLTPRMHALRPEKDQYIQEAENEINRWKMKSNLASKSPKNLKPIFVNLKELEDEPEEQQRQANASRAKSRRKREERLSNSKHRQSTQNAYPNYKIQASPAFKIVEESQDNVDAREVAQVEAEPVHPLSPAMERKTRKQGLNLSTMTRPGEQSTVIDVDRDRDKIKTYLAKEVDDYLNTEKGEENAQFMNDSYPAHVHRSIVPEIVAAPVHAKNMNTKKSPKSKNQLKDVDKYPMQYDQYDSRINKDLPLYEDSIVISEPQDLNQRFDQRQFMERPKEHQPEHDAAYQPPAIYPKPRSFVDPQYDRVPTKFSQPMEPQNSGYQPPHYASRFQPPEAMPESSVSSVKIHRPRMKKKDDPFKKQFEQFVQRKYSANSDGRLQPVNSFGNKVNNNFAAPQHADVRHVNPVRFKKVEAKSGRPSNGRSQVKTPRANFSAHANLDLKNSCRPSRIKHRPTKAERPAAHQPAAYTARDPGHQAEEDDLSDYEQLQQDYENQHSSRRHAVSPHQPQSRAMLEDQRELYEDHYRR